MRGFNLTGWAGLLVLAVSASAGAVAAVPPPPTFAADVAPLVYQHCVECHRPGGDAPFALVDFESVRSRARGIVEVTESGFMPPWLPKHGYGPELEGTRGLAPDEIDLLRRWLEAGAPEGDGTLTPPAPQFPGGWRLGEPDLIVELPEAYTVPAEGADIIRNFVIPIPLQTTVSVRAIDVRGGNARVLHHAFLQVDRTSSSRKRDAADPEPGFSGMDINDGINPDGHFLGWTPGARPYESYPGTEWQIEPGTDLVLQLHMLPSGKRETIRPQIGIYFSPTPPSRKPFILLLKAKDIDIAPGNAAYRIERRFTTPLPLELVRLYPHAHYLGRSFELYAELPDQRKQPLLSIPDWDFNWQGDYRFKEPVQIPAGATIVMAWVFDNSDDNPRNPNVPATRVRYGGGSLDEMAEVAIQALVPEDLNRAPLQAAYAEMQLREDAGNFFAYTTLAQAQAQQGEAALAEKNYRTAIALNPRYAPALNNLGVLHARGGDHDRALALFNESLEIEPDYLDARHNRAAEYYRRGDHDTAVRMLRWVVERNPRLLESQLLLAQALRDGGDVSGALSQLADALERFNDDSRVFLLAGECALLSNRVSDAQRWLARAVELAPSDLDARYRLGLAHLQAGAPVAAADVFAALIDLAPKHALGHMRLGQIKSRQQRTDEAADHFEAAWRESDARQRSSMARALQHHRELGALAVALQRIGNEQAARAAFEAATRGARAVGDIGFIDELRAWAELALEGAR